MFADLWMKRTILVVELLTLDLATFGQFSKHVSQRFSRAYKTRYKTECIKTITIFQKKLSYQRAVQPYEAYIHVRTQSVGRM